MSPSAELAKQFREVYLSGKWVTNTNLKEQLSLVNHEQAMSKVGSLNTIAMLAFHVNYYVAGVANVLKGGSLDIRDKFSFDLPAIESEEDWQALLNQLWKDGEEFAALVEQLPEEKLDEVFVKEAYGTYRRNIHVIIEHSYYHLGQVVMLRKLLTENLVSAS
ncbi:MAG: DinB family protein [Bacteroidota bacterium]